MHSDLKLLSGDTVNSKSENVNENPESTTSEKPIDDSKK